VLSMPTERSSTPTRYHATAGKTMGSISTLTKLASLTAIAGALVIGPAAAEVQAELVTAPDAILCVSPENLDVANQRQVAASLTVLRAMGCIRIENGIRTRLLEGADVQRPWRVRLYPVGISNGVELWGMPSSFTTPDGAKVRPANDVGA